MSDNEEDNTNRNKELLKKTRKKVATKNVDIGKSIIGTFDKYKEVEGKKKGKRPALEKDSDSEDVEFNCILGMWVVKNFNPKTCTLVMEDGSMIKITRELIHDILGIPMGDIKVKSLKEKNLFDPVTAKWRGMVPEIVNREKIQISQLETFLCTLSEADWLFDIGFLSLFFSIFGQGNKDGTINERLIPYLEKTDKIHQMDWCSYVLESLVNECTVFSASDKFSGPLLLLALIYVNSTVSKNVKVEKTVSAFKAWNSNMLLKRQQEELDLNWFGLLPIVKGLEFVEQKKVNKKKKLESITEDGDETAEKVEQKEDFHYKTFEEMKKILKDNLLKGKNLMEDTDNKLDIALAINYDDEELKNIIGKRNELFVTVYRDEEELRNIQEDDEDKDRDLEKNDDEEETDGDDDDDDAPNGDNDDKDDDETDGHNDDKDDDDKDENNENLRNEKENKNVDEGNKEEVGNENIKDDNVEKGISVIEQKDENVEKEKEKKKVQDDMVWDKTKAIVPFVDYHDYEINDTQSSTEDAEYNDNVSGLTHVTVEANVAGASNAVDNQENLNCFFRNELEDFEPLTLSQETGKKYSNKRRKLPVFDDISILNTQLESEKIHDASLVVHQMIEDITKLPLISRALKEAVQDVTPVDARPSFNKIKIKLERDSDGKVHAKKIDDVPCSVEKGNVNAVKVANHKVINAAKDKTVQVAKKEVPKKKNAKVAVKRSAKAVEVPPDKVVDAAKKKGDAMTQFKQPRPATKIIKDDYQTPKRGKKRVAQVLEEDLILSGKRMVNPSFALVSPYFERKTMYTKPFTVAEKKILEYIWSYDSPEGNIIDLWSTILNDEEIYKGKQSVTRNIYCSTGMLDLNCDAVLVNRHEDLNCHALG
ncbi:hypothetical protein Tco_0026572 [Tanacetum coccineum]